MKKYSVPDTTKMLSILGFKYIQVNDKFIIVDVPENKRTSFTGDSFIDYIMKIEKVAGIEFVSFVPTISLMFKWREGN